jgi:tetratricopeptide (TPR) repeat protein
MREIANLFGEAVRHHQAGRLADAERLYRQILALDTRHADSLHLLGVIAEQAGRHKQAIDLIRKAIRIRDTVPAYHNNLGNILAGTGKPGGAVVHYRRAVALDPNYAEAHNNLGNVLAGMGKHPDALTHYERAVALRPDYAEAHNNLGNALLEQGRLADAVTHYRQAVDLRPDYAEAHINLGNALLSQGAVADAMTHHQRAVALRPDYAEAHYNLGNALARQGKLAEAMACYRRAVGLKPDFADAHHHLGNALLGEGELEAAQRSYETAIRLAPRSGRHHRALLNTRRVATDDRHLAAMQKLAREMSSLPVTEQTELHFALGKAYADVGQSARSFRHLLQGNALKRRELGYDEAATLDMLHRIRAVFTPDLLRTRSGVGDPSTAPVFIIGMPRSGTTLIEQILASHPKIFGAGEIPEFTRLALAAAPSFPETVPALPEAALRQLGASYCNAVSARAPWAGQITDKMPGNFAFSGLIHLALPNARIIHMRRVPIDTCVSCFSILFTTGHPYTYDLRELGRYYRAYEALMEHWRRVLPAGMMLEVQYEDVVAGVERQARQIVAHCGMEWDDACLAFHRTQRSVQTASAVQVRQPIYRSSVGRWQAYGDLLRPLIDELALVETKGTSP